MSGVSDEPQAAAGLDRARTEAAVVMALKVRDVAAEAVFCSCLQPSDTPIPEQVRGVVANIARVKGCRWCAAEVAQEFGDHPETAAARMRWARGLVEDAYRQRRRTSWT